MKPRIRTSLLVMFVGVTLAAIAQEHCPPLTFLRLKPPLLLGVAAYYAMRRETGWAVAAAVWCGLLEDALGFVPCGVSPLAFGACLLAARFAVRPQPQVLYGPDYLFHFFAALVSHAHRPTPDHRIGF